MRRRCFGRPHPCGKPNDAARWGTHDLVLRATTTDDLKAYLAGTGIVETDRLEPARQHEEAWFLGLRMNSGVDSGCAGRTNLDPEMVAPAKETASGSHKTVCWISTANECGSRPEDG